MGQLKKKKKLILAQNIRWEGSHWAQPDRHACPVAVKQICYPEAICFMEGLNRCNTADLAGYLIEIFTVRHFTLLKQPQRLCLYQQIKHNEGISLSIVVHLSLFFKCQHTHTGMLLFHATQCSLRQQQLMIWGIVCANVHPQQAVQMGPLPFGG